MLYRTDGPNEVVRIEGDYRPRQIDSAEVVTADASDPRWAVDPIAPTGTSRSPSAAAVRQEYAG
jgi:hypothetical protein